MIKIALALGVAEFCFFLFLAKDIFVSFNLQLKLEAIDMRMKLIKKEAAVFGTASFSI